MSRILNKSGGYRKLYSFNLATIIHLGTIAFCKRFVPWQEDALGKVAGQMIGAARSGRINIAEGSERAGTSAETEIKLTDVARASLAELQNDLETWLAEREMILGASKTPSVSGSRRSRSSRLTTARMCCTSTGPTCIGSGTVSTPGWRARIPRRSRMR